jgi:hypothetical protein
MSLTSLSIFLYLRVFLPKVILQLLVRVDLVPDEIEKRLPQSLAGILARFSRFWLLHSLTINSHKSCHSQDRRSADPSGYATLEIIYILMEGWVWVWLDLQESRKLGWESYMHYVDRCATSHTSIHIHSY